MRFRRKRDWMGGDVEERGREEDVDVAFAVLRRARRTKINDHDQMNPWHFLPVASKYMLCLLIPRTNQRLHANWKLRHSVWRLASKNLSPRVFVWRFCKSNQKDHNFSSPLEKTATKYQASFTKQRPYRKLSGVRCVYVLLSSTFLPKCMRWWYQSEARGLCRGGRIRAGRSWVILVCLWQGKRGKGNKENIQDTSPLACRYHPFWSGKWGWRGLWAPLFMSRGLGRYGNWWCSISK